jgi:tripartite-type tricarboxylate transporter receptor subunit TctC
MDSGQLRAIGISSGRSYPGLIDLPEIGKTGLPGYEGSSAWVGLMGPAGLSPEIREKLASACETSLRSEETTKAMSQFGMLPGSGKPEQLESLIRSDFSLLKRQVEFTGIQPK